MRPGPPMDKIKAKEFLLEVKETFDNLKIKFWLAAGTCLGAVREGRFISYDFDMDIMMLARDVSPRLCKALSKIAPVGLTKAWSNKLIGIYLLKHQIYMHIPLEYYFSPKDIYVGLGPRPHWQNCIMPGKWLRDDCWGNFLDTKFRVPNPPEEYLEQYYGKNWRIPFNAGRGESFRGYIWRKQWKRIPPAEFIKYVRWIEKHPKEF